MRQPANAKRIRPNRPEYGIFPHQTSGMAWLESDYPRTVTCWLFDVRGLN